MNSPTPARAYDFQESAVYYPQVRRGYVAWVYLFPFGNGELGCCFTEIRKGRNPGFTPPTLEFVEAMVLPYRTCADLLPASNRDLITESVYMKSGDGGKSWQPTGRCPVRTRHCCPVGFPDGRLVRLVGTQYLCYDADDRLSTIVEESRDGGNTWKRIARFLDGVVFHGHKFKKLRDGSIVAAGALQPAFGPGLPRETRHTRPTGQRQELDSCFMISRDGGYTWSGPHYVLQGVPSWEFDFVELPDGRLLFISSTIQNAPPVRQIVARTSTGYLNEPVMEIHRGAPADPSDLEGGFTPETVAMASNGLIVGARRCNVYSCSNDLGENWYEIAGLPNCGYQPIIEALPDGRFLTAWHHGTDSRVGEFDMFIGTHAFGLEHRLPQPTRLELTRSLSQDGSQYVNEYRATLTADGKPVAGRAIALRVSPVLLPDGRENPADVIASSDVRKAVTDENGAAWFVLAEMNVIPDIHFAYRVVASFSPAAADTCGACTSARRLEYAVTPARNNPANYPVYNNHGWIMITPAVEREFPDLCQVVARFDKHNPDATLQAWVQAAGDETRARQMLDLLIRHHVITPGGNGTYHWYRAVHCGDEIIKGARICPLAEYCT